ncbi:MAG: TonB-dependent receptor, partial [Acidobacteriota bacterium]
MRYVIRRLFWALLLFLVAGRVAVAQEMITITGSVTTHADGLPVPGAIVSVVGSETTATTDPSGRYALQVPSSLVRADRLSVKVEALGLPPKTTEVVVHAPALTVDVSLTLGFTEQITVGSRTVGAQAERAVPVDVITQDQIASSGYSETAQVIQSLAPSFNFPRPTITDGTDTVRPATLRGLGPDQVLVLVNGKRRHQSALVHLNGSIGRGSTGVDLNAIPLSAIDHIEVLRDGAAAQYGSDAIAG